MIRSVVMTDEKKPPRSAIVINTAAGRRIKPPCPMCGAVFWMDPKPDPKMAPGRFQILIMAKAEGSENLMGLSTKIYVCGNCGFVWHIGMQENRQHKEGDDE
jgi:predicted RNA-binding Zn-ribbon protein involved in translation (DUF1610 family)